MGKKILKIKYQYKILGEKNIFICGSKLPFLGVVASIFFSKKSANSEFYTKNHSRFILVMPKMAQNTITNPSNKKDQTTKKPHHPPTPHTPITLLHAKSLLPKSLVFQSYNYCLLGYWLYKAIKYSTVRWWSQLCSQCHEYSNVTVYYHHWSQNGHLLPCYMQLWYISRQSHYWHFS